MESILPLHKEVEGVLGATGGKAGLDVSTWGVIISFLLASLIFTVFAPTQSDYNWAMLFLLAPLWLPLVVGRFALLRFIQMRRMAFLSEKKFVLLEIRLPRDTAKTPAAMETVLSNLHLGPGESTWHKKYVVGGVRPWWSLELVSIEGRVHFYIWTREDFRRAVEAYMYAQYANIEIIEAADYSRLRDAAHPPYKMSAYEYKHGKPDPYPIRTYVDYHLDKPPGKDEEQVNPLAQVLELLGSAGPGEQIWIQIMIRTTKNEKWRGKLNKDKKPYSWKDEAKELVDKTKKSYTDEKTGAANPTEQQKDLIKCIERNTGKMGFDVGIRAIYSAPIEKHSGSVGGYLSNIFKPFSSESLNSLEGSGAWSNAFPDYPWANPGGKKEAAIMPEALELYRRRAYFYPPYRGNWMIMSTEELATLFHIPPSTVQTPSMPRIQSTTGAAPANLPQ
ncbi:MAG TPA: hypothetical protein VEB18_03570 [Candidatus Paceibacterota bacterium]|nr:hypothetical protein [Candidatus Paceibacterota bacterium]